MSNFNRKDQEEIRRALEREGISEITFSRTAACHLRIEGIYDGRKVLVISPGTPRQKRWAAHRAVKDARRNIHEMKQKEAKRA